MAAVTNLQVRPQTGNDGTLLATWQFSSTKVVVPSNTLKVGDYVDIKDGATYYNGVAIPNWVAQDTWQITSISGDRVVLGRNLSGSNTINSPIKLSDIEAHEGQPNPSAPLDTVAGYNYTWFYDTGDGVWFVGDSGQWEDVTNLGITYNPPENYVRVHFHIIPYAKTHKVNGVDTPYWTGELRIAEYLKSSNPPEVPSAPTVEIEQYELTATLDNIDDPRSDEIEFQVFDNTTLFKTGTAQVVTAQAIFKCSVNAGGSYRVRARAANLVGTSRVYSDWGSYSSSYETIPSPPADITTIRGASSTSVYLEWSVVNSAETYDIEYTTNVNYFDASSEVTSVTGIEVNRYTVTGLESGDEYFFRVRAVNEQGESGWTSIKSVVIGKPPSAPTTWSSNTTVIVGEPLNLYWVHNSEDGSKEKYAQLEIYINGVKETHTIENPDFEDEEEEETTHYYTVDTSQYTEGTKLEWRARTSGITNEFGDWSVMRTVDIYARPTLTLSLTDQNGSAITTLTSFPLFVKGLAGPATQMPIGYSVTITADESYQTVNYLGETEMIQQGDVVYSTYVDTNDPLLLEISAQDVNFDSGISYTVSATAAMNSGLAAEDTASFDVSWTDESIPLDLSIAIDPQTYVAYVTPYSQDPDTGNYNPGYSLAVYRREFDGTFTLIGSGLDSATATALTDPHPSLDYARYRVIAMSNTTGAISYYDPPGYPVGCTSIIIQWDEDWSNFDTTNMDERAVPPWEGSLLELPYNIDISDSVTPEVELVNYAGRTYPVSYYGTSVDTTASWSTEIPATDTDTIYALRRLQIWKGDCYVREPNGTGYWASINVSFSTTHLELTIPITIDITRVEGGM